MLGNEIENMKKEMENVTKEQKSFAYELVLELNKRAKRDFILHIVELSIIFIIFICTFAYFTEIDYSYEELSQEQVDTTNSQIIGEIN